jgi:hypothetical protein
VTNADAVDMVAEAYDDGFIDSFAALEILTTHTDMSILDAAGALCDWAYVQQQRGRQLDGWKYR